jgi:hypothetical protein
LAGFRTPPAVVRSRNVEEFRAILARPHPGVVVADEGREPARAAHSQIGCEKNAEGALEPGGVGLAPEPHSGLEGGWQPVWEAGGPWLFNLGSGVAEAPPVASVMPRPEMAELLSRWVRRSAIGGDARRGAVRLELDQGRFAGAALVVTAEGNQVAVDLRLPEGPDAADLAERLRRRLAQRGYTADVVVTALG